MEVDAAATTEARGGGYGDVDWTVDRSQEAIERCGGGVTKNSPLPTSEDRRHPTGVEVWGAVTQCVDAAMNAV
ncbi:MAG TPA: hypothetical protein VNB59_06595, partial [Solirubrobacterales bacterium]|nr:hypothetical protein [Solirubrobacterales bacterium]